ncbi:MAG TPA: hypothetical protein H9768_02750 [Candidatus Mailhella merdavium]|nr:hypothetical protein [Candidatus Mailhella merdavium]
MPGLTETRDAAVSLLRKTFPELCRVEAFSGELNMDEAARRSFPPGISLLVAVVAAENDAPADSLVFSVMGTFGALVISNSAAGAEHAEGDALSAAERAALSLHGATYGLEGVSPARVESLEACQDGELAENGLCVWAIIWKQALVFGECDERA